MRGRGLPFSARISRLKASLDFGEVAAALGLSGSSRHGWDCPACCGEQTVNERRDRAGGRCAACGKGYDSLGLVMAAEDLGASAAADRLQGILDDRDGQGARLGDLFSDKKGKP